MLLHCDAGCPVEAVVRAVGLEMPDLFPLKDDWTSRNGKPGKPASSGRAFAMAMEAVAELERRYGKPSALWTYHDAQGAPVGIVARWDGAAGKTIRPVSRHARGWRIGAMPEPRPLYGLPALAACAASAKKRSKYSKNSAVGGGGGRIFRALLAPRKHK